MDDSSSVTIPPRSVDRRAFLSTLGMASAAFASGCHSNLTGVPGSYNGAEHLTSRVSPPTLSVAPGLQALGLGGEASSRDGKLFVPTSYSPSQPLPLVVLLHGAGGSAANWFGSYAARAEAARYLLLAPDSRFTTWDASLGIPFQTDLPFLDLALRATFNRCAVDAARIALVGYSDGASYALSVGLANGDLFNRVIAYSPGYFVDSARRGKPKLFFSHGTADLVLPIDRASRALVKKFRGEGYGIEYVEFEGGHEVPSSISDQAFRWLDTA